MIARYKQCVGPKPVTILQSQNNILVNKQVVLNAVYSRKGESQLRTVEINQQSSQLFTTL